MKETIITLISSILSLFIGGGGVFAYLSSKNKLKQTAHESAVAEWKELYDEMRKRLDEQEKENDKLKDEVNQLKQSIVLLTNELQNYKKYDSYINELEKYIEHLMHVIKGVSSEDAYKNLNAKRPIKRANSN